MELEKQLAEAQAFSEQLAKVRMRWYGPCSSVFWWLVPWFVLYGVCDMLMCCVVSVLVSMCMCMLCDVAYILL